MKFPFRPLSPVWISCLVIVLSAAVIICLPRLFPSFDVLIKDGKIYDGFSAQPYLSDIGIKGSRIIAIGNLTGSARKTIGAKDLIVTPGFIDVTNHCDLTFKNAGWLKTLALVMPEWKGNYNYLYQGVTTVVTGGCGQGYADANQWLKPARALTFGSNVYFLAPHGAIRQKLFGKKQPQHLDARQIERFKKAVEREMKKGALGLSVGLEYSPGQLADVDELVELAGVVRKYDGLVAFHLRDYSGRINDNGNYAVLAALREAIEVARRSGAPVHISHLELLAPRHDLGAYSLIGPIDNARAAGLDITADQYPYPSTIAFLDHLIPDKFKNNNWIKDEYKTPAGREQFKKALGGILSYLGPDQILISQYSDKPDYDRKTLQEIAVLQGKKAIDIFMELAYQDERPLCIFFDQSPETVAALMPYSFVFTASDGASSPAGSLKPHPRYYGTFPRKIKRYALEGQVMGLNYAIKSMTSLPAAKFRLGRRGIIEVDYQADIAVIDPGKIIDNATYANPRQYAEGVQYVLINGVVSLDKGKATGRRGGQVCKRVTKK